MTTSLQPAYALVPGANLEAYVHTVNSIPLLSVCLLYTSDAADDTR